MKRSPLDCTLPEHLKKEVHPMLAKWEWLIPAWVRQVRLGIDVEQKGQAISRVSIEYLVFNIKLGAGWSELTLQEKEDAIVHELCHLYTTPLRASVYESVDMLVDEAHRAAFKTHIDGAMEFCT